jgi:hypothetical protein
MITIAQDCFKENIQLFANPKTEPEKYNLYNGLMALADKIDEIESLLKKVNRILTEIDLRVLNL